MKRRFALVIFFAGLLVTGFLYGQEPATLYTGPYLQNVSQNGIVIMWETTDSVSGTVEYGLSAEKLELSVMETEAKKIHEIKLTGLKTGTRYYYRCRWDDAVTKVWHFKTAPSENCERIKIAAYGDSRSDPAMHLKIAKLIAAEHPDLVLHSGDLVADGRKFDLWKPQFFDPIKPYAAEVPILPVLGNHERNSVYYYNFYSLNNNEAWWSTDYGPVHIIGLDSNQPGGPGTDQYKWLLQDLEKSKNAGWKIVMFHHPLFSAHPTRPVHEMRSVWHPLFRKYGVKLVINGHDHYYNRTYPIGDAKNQVVYIVTAGGGAPLYPVVDKEYDAFTESIHNFVILDISGEKISGTAIDDNGNVIDTFTIDKNPAKLPEKIISFALLNLKNSVQKEVSQLKLVPDEQGNFRLTGKLFISVPVQYSASLSFRTVSSAGWQVEPAALTKVVGPQNAVQISIEGTAPKGNDYPLPVFHFKMSRQGTGQGAVPSAPLAEFSVSLEQAQIDHILQLHGTVPIIRAGLDFVKNFPHSPFAYRVAANLRLLTGVKGETRVETIADLHRLIDGLDGDSQAAIFYPGLFLFGDFSGWHDWLALAKRGNVEQGNAIATNLYYLLKSRKLPGSAVKNWHIIGPFDNMNDEGFARVYDPEKKIDFTADYSGKNGQKLKWRKIIIAGKQIDFTQYVSDPENGIVYAAAKISAEKKTIAPLLLGSDDAAVVWVNGTEVFRLHQNRGLKVAENFILADFHKGENTVLVKVSQLGGDWGLSLHVVDKDDLLTF